MERYFHDAQWVRKHWDLDVDFETDSEEDAAFGSESLEKEESPEKTDPCPQPDKQQPILDEEDRRVEGGAQNVSKEDAKGLLDQRKEVEAGEEETSLEAEHKEVGQGKREPAFSDRYSILVPEQLLKYFHLSNCRTTRWETVWWALYFFGLLLASLCF